MIKKVKIKRNISKAELLWEQLWRQWRDGKIITPLDELLTYTSILQDGGHIQLMMFTIIYIYTSVKRNKISI